MRLSTKIVLLITSVVLSLGVLVAISVKDVVIISLGDELEKRAEAIALNLSERIANLILLGDYYTTQEAIEEVKAKDKDIEYIFVTDEDGDIFAHTFLGGIPDGLLQWNPLYGKAKSIQLLRTEKGNIRDIGINIFDGMNAELHIGLSEKRLTQTIRKIRDVIILLTIFVTVISALIAFYMGRLLIIKPLNRLVEFAKSLGRGEFGKRLEIESMDEIGELSCVFDKLSVQLKEEKEKSEKAHNRVLQTEKLLSLGRLSGSLAHELKNPITTLKFLFENFKYKGIQSITKDDVEVVLEEIGHMDKIITMFNRFAKQMHPILSEQDIPDIMRHVLSLLNPHIQRHCVKVLNDLSNNLPPVQIDRSLMEQVFLNLITNSIEAMPDGGEIRISGDIMNGFLEVRIEDTGNGIPDDIKTMVFDPFFTTKDKGTGLGLSIAYNIVKAHKGEIWFENRKSGGTIFIVKIPKGDKHG